MSVASNADLPVLNVSRENEPRHGELAGTRPGNIQGQGGQGNAAQVMEAEKRRRTEGYWNT
jgi:hypothetical protein